MLEICVVICVVNPLLPARVGCCRSGLNEGSAEAAESHLHCRPSLSLTLPSCCPATVEEEKWHGRGRRFDPGQVHHIFKYLPRRSLSWDSNRDLGSIYLFRQSSETTGGTQIRLRRGNRANLKPFAFRFPPEPMHLRRRLFADEVARITPARCAAEDRGMNTSWAAGAPRQRAD